jgi:hypothetical protein
MEHRHVAQRVGEPPHRCGVGPGRDEDRRGRLLPVIPVRSQADGQESQQGDGQRGATE